MRASDFITELNCQYGEYYCSHDKKMKCRKTPKKSRTDEKCWDGYKKKGMKTMFGKRVPNCVKKEDKSNEELNELIGTVTMVHKTSGKEIVVFNDPDVVKNKEKLGFIVQKEEIDEDLKDWFGKGKKGGAGGGGWDRYNSKGERIGKCGDAKKGEGKPKCLPAKKAYALGKKGRASAAKRKRRKDPNANRRGKAINVNTKKKK